MADSKNIQFKSNFLKAVIQGEYEPLDAKLPGVMNLLERDSDGNSALHCCAYSDYFTTFDKILVCPHPAVGLLIAQKNNENLTALDLLLKRQNDIDSDIKDFINFLKDKQNLSGELIIILINEKQDSKYSKFIDLLKKNQSLGSEDIIFLLKKIQDLTLQNLGGLLEKMKQRSLPTTFAQVLDASLERMKNPDYVYNEALKSSVEQFYAIVAQEISITHNLTYTPTYYSTKAPAVTPNIPLVYSSTSNKILNVSTRK